MSFGAVILAGGKSSRMGCDKALLEFSGQSLLARQIETARAAGAREIFISGRPGVDYSLFGCAVLEDEFFDLGPLAGIARGLSAVHEPLLLVLAVDMPHLNSDFLKELHACCRDGLGVIPQCGEFSEPLAAFYPKSSLGLLQKLLSGQQPGQSPGAKKFAESCVQAGLTSFYPVPPAESAVFKSWNVPADLPR